MRAYTIVILGALLSISVLANLYLLTFNLAMPASQTAATATALTTNPINPKIDNNTALNRSQILQVLETSNNTHLANINQLFAQEQFQQAIDAYLLLSKAEQQKLKQTWLVQLDILLTQGKPEAVLTFCKYFLQHWPDEQTVMELLAKAYIARGDLLYGLELYYQLSRLLPPTKDALLYTKIHQLALSEIKRFSEEQAWSALSYFVIPLLDYEADYPPYLLALARAHYQLQSYKEALTPLVSVTTDPDYGAQALELEHNILIAMTKLEAIALTSYGAHFIISGQINGKYSTELMIDTGASLSVISRARFEELAIDSGIELIGKRKIATAGGDVTAPIYRLDSFAINQYEVKNIEFVVLELENLEGSDGLLGMNFLQNFKFEIDQQEKLLLLKEHTTK